jgi:hypothetical protein
VGDIALSRSNHLRYISCDFLQDKHLTLSPATSEGQDYQVLSCMWTAAVPEGVAGILTTVRTLKYRLEMGCNTRVLINGNGNCR